MAIAHFVLFGIVWWDTRQFTEAAKLAILRSATVYQQTLILESRYIVPVGMFYGLQISCTEIQHNQKLPKPFSHAVFFKVTT